MAETPSFVVKEARRIKDWHDRRLGDLQTELYGELRAGVAESRTEIEALAQQLRELVEDFERLETESMEALATARRERSTLKGQLTRTRNQLAKRQVELNTIRTREKELERAVAVCRAELANTPPPLTYPEILAVRTVAKHQRVYLYEVRRIGRSGSRGVIAASSMYLARAMRPHLASPVDEERAIHLLKRAGVLHDLPTAWGRVPASHNDLQFVLLSDAKLRERCGALELAVQVPRGTVEVDTRRVIEDDIPF